jgi:hypothetical protein
MQYLALIYDAPGSGPAHGSADFQKMMADYTALTAKMRADGVYVDGNPLASADKATSVKVRNGKAETMDGPFAVTKEQLGGYYLLDCKNLDDALRYAEMIPTARWGTIEVRPVLSM